MAKEQKNKTATQITLHSVRNMLGEKSQTCLFSQHDQKFSDEFSVPLSGSINRFGIDLTDIQSRIVEGILRGLSETSYKGNTEVKEKEILAQEKYAGNLPSSYKYIKEIPRLKATQVQILEWSGINQSSIACWARAVEAIAELGTKQYCFYYDRLTFDDNGNPLRDKDGKWKKEEVIVVDTLFMIKEIRNEESGTLKYYEISPSSIFLDQRESYFMLVPYNWREEVKVLVGNKKASSYTFRFLLFLRYQYELKRRSNNKNASYQIQWSPEEIAIAIKMPDSIHRRKKKRMNEILEDAYEVAKRLGYLTEYERKSYIDVLTLNHDKYFNPKDDSLKKAIDTINDPNGSNFSDATRLFDFFHNQRKDIDSKYFIPKDNEKAQQINLFKLLLNQRNAEEIEKIISWSCKKTYWCTRLSSPETLMKHFNEAWTEYQNQYKPSVEEKTQINKSYALKLKAALEEKGQHKFVLEVLSKYAEIGNGVHQPICIPYDDIDFKQKIEQAINKWGVKIF